MQGFTKLLEKRAHLMLLDPENATAIPKSKTGEALHGAKAAQAIFASLCGPGKAFVTYARLARWSIRGQHVRPGSGALVPQPRWPTHWTQPASMHGAYYSARSRDDVSPRFVTSTTTNDAKTIGQLHRSPPPSPRRTPTTPRVRTVARPIIAAIRMSNEPAHRRAPALKSGSSTSGTFRRTFRRTSLSRSPTRSVNTPPPASPSPRSHEGSAPPPAT